MVCDTKIFLSLKYSREVLEYSREALDTVTFLMITYLLKCLVITVYIVTGFSVEIDKCPNKDQYELFLGKCFCSPGWEKEPKRGDCSVPLLKNGDCDCPNVPDRTSKYLKKIPERLL